MSLLLLVARSNYRPCRDRLFSCRTRSSLRYGPAIAAMGVTVTMEGEGRVSWEITVGQPLVLVVHKRTRGRNANPALLPRRTDLDLDVTFGLDGGRPERFGGHLQGSPRRLQRSQIGRRLFGCFSDVDIDVDVCVDADVDVNGLRAKGTLQSICRLRSVDDHAKTRDISHQPRVGDPERSAIKVLLAVGYRRSGSKG
jgi:hypothetical protein